MGAGGLARPPVRREIHRLHLRVEETLLRQPLLLLRGGGLKAAEAHQPLGPRLRFLPLQKVHLLQQVAGGPRDVSVVHGA
eukprot:9449436-Pyramimonas_sp.AAC.1